MSAVEDSLQGNCYFFTGAMDWDIARSECISNGASMVSISSSRENQFLRYNIRINGAWIGGWLVDGRYIWEDFNEMSYEHWGKNQPDAGDDKHCVLMDSNGFWVTSQW